MHGIFKGDTERDFLAWCKYRGLRCGGNPFFVGFDSVYYGGEFRPKAQADYLREQEKNALEKNQAGFFIPFTYF